MTEEINIRCQHFFIKNKKFTMVFEEGSVSVERLTLRLKRNGDSIRIPLQMKRITTKGKCRLYCSCEPDALEEGYYELTGWIQEDGRKKEVLVGKQKKGLMLQQLLFPKWMKTRCGTIFYPYINNSGYFMFLYRKEKVFFDTRRFLLKDYLAFFTYLLWKPWLDHKKIWMICEKNGNMAQENGFYFFKYCMENLPPKEQRRIFFTIAPESPDARNLLPYKKQVLDYMSFRYLVLLHAAELLIAPETKMFFYEMDTINTVPKILYRMRKPHVFLQHGVTGMKMNYKGFHKASGNRCNLFVTSSAYEKDIIKKWFGYGEEEILVTGFPRWDVLEDKADPKHREILMMPTWREWLERTKNEQFVDSTYYRHYQALLESEQMRVFLEEQDLYLNFYAHPKFREYLKLFSSQNKRIRVIAFGETPLNELLMRCSLMITDYSSACWDVFWQKKPVLFDHFDLGMYKKNTGSFMDLDRELFGDRFFTQEELFKLLEEYVERDFKEKEKYGNKRELLLPMTDHDNSRRIYEEIIRRKFASGITAKLVKKIALRQSGRCR